MKLAKIKKRILSIRRAICPACGKRNCFSDNSDRPGPYEDKMTPDEVLANLLELKICVCCYDCWAMKIRCFICEDLRDTYLSYLRQK